MLLSHLGALLTQGKVRVRAPDHWMCIKYTAVSRWCLVDVVLAGLHCAASIPGREWLCTETRESVSG